MPTLREPAGIRPVAALGLPNLRLISNIFRFASFLISPSLYNLHISQLTIVICGGLWGRVAMINEHEIRERLASYLDGKESVNDFANWLSRESTSIRFHDDAGFDLAAPIQIGLDEFFDGIIDEQLLQNELRNLIQPGRVQERNVEFWFDDLAPHDRGKPAIRLSLGSRLQFEDASFA